MIEEVNYEKVIRQRFTRQNTVVYFYTPLCGTCKLAKQMLEIAIVTLPNDKLPTIMACNLNHMPAIAREWELTSVPCLAFLKDGKVTEKVYSFQSVDNIYNKLWKFNINTQKNSG
ncbi:thioredoxin family protein [Pseudalkalibacillus berkeleyi]|uniref:Thioredoxin family protein n=1 Tax=Pseudalkalibacillus berkeleyi TaxID=1069813 RepID=A0ABS9H3R0_9BACL|nr:thioredoxin family protein [Pseudalkalibacillus berkeleyi]MCF6138576.1 thioredoxin family protein [Pseudalkalibacillus berkeleyi]